jgi:hypothetical protein
MYHWLFWLRAKYIGQKRIIIYTEICGEIKSQHETIQLEKYDILYACTFYEI